MTPELRHLRAFLAVAIAAATVPGYHPRPDVAFCTLEGLPPTPLLLATSAHPQTRLTHSFEDVARTVAAEVRRSRATAARGQPR